MLFRILRQMILVLFGVYCIYHLLNGQNGLLAYFKVRKELVVNQAILKQLDAEKSNLQQVTKLLSSQHICKDLLEEQVRNMIHYSYPGDVLVVTNS